MAGASHGGMKTALLSQRFSKFGCEKSPFPFISPCVRLLLKNVTMSGEKVEWKRESNTSYTAAHATHDAAHTHSTRTKHTTYTTHSAHTTHTTHTTHNTHTPRTHHTINVSSAQ